jgi:hypothetical protein
VLVRRGGARIVLALAKTSGFQLSGRSGGLFENGVGELADELLLGSGECGDLVDLALQFGSRAAFGGGVAVLVVDGFVTGHPGTALGDGMVSPEVVQAGLRLRVTEDQTQEQKPQEVDAMPDVRDPGDDTDVPPDGLEEAPELVRLAQT